MLSSTNAVVADVAGSIDDFFYISQGAAPVIDDVDDAANLVETREAFSLLGNHIPSRRFQV